ncbi:MAG: hypothetical protein ABI921_02350 [Panacibacter sp.]
MTDTIQSGSESNLPDKGMETSAHATLNLRRLEKVQSIFQFSAAVVLLLFISLIIYSSVKLHDIKKEISLKTTLLKQQDAIMSRNKDSIARQEIYIDQLQTSSNGFQKAIDSIVKVHPELAGVVKKSIENNILKTDSSKQIQPRVYIQIANNDQRHRAAEIATLLQTDGFIVPGIENMEGKTNTLTTSEVRYYKSNDIVSSDTQTISKIFKIASLPVPMMRAFPASVNVRPRHYEIWFGDDFTTQNAVVIKQPVIPPANDPTPQPKHELRYAGLITDSRYTGNGYFSDIRNKDGQTVVTVHVTDVDRSMGEATMYISTGTEKTASFAIRANQPVVQYLNDGHYKVTVTVTSFSKPKFVRIANYIIQVDERVD